MLRSVRRHPRMRRQSAYLVIAVAILAATGVAWFAAQPAHDVETPAPAAADASPAQATRAIALASTPQARALDERRGFERDIHRFLAGAGQMGAVERSERADALASGVDDYARAGQMSAGEAFLLQAALIKANLPAGAEQTDRLAQLAERYRDDATRREAAWTARQARDPQFHDYKAREAAIVAEVMALAAIPDGLTRDEYLRRRLQQAREQAYE